MMNMVAPEGAVDEGEGIVVFHDLSGSDFGGSGHQLWKRPGLNGEISYSGFSPVTTWAIRCAVTGASRIPSRKCPAATKYPGVAVAPRIGRSSGVPGRSPAQASCTRAPLRAGTIWIAA